MRVVYRFASVANIGDLSHVSFGVDCRFKDPETGQEKHKVLNGDDNVFNSLQEAIDFASDKDIFKSGGSVIILPFLVYV